MGSLLIDAVLMVALVVTAVRSGRMYRELKSLRESESGLAQALAESERSLNKACEAVIALKHDGLDTMRRLEAESNRAAEVGLRLAGLVERAEFHPGTSRRPAAPAPIQTDLAKAS